MREKDSEKVLNKKTILKVKGVGSAVYGQRQNFCAFLILGLFP